MKFKIILLLLFFLFFSKKTYADSDFEISTNTSYTVQETGNTHFSQTIEITNKKDFIYTPSYSLTTGLKDIKNASAYSDGSTLKTVVSNNKDGTKTLEITFDKKIVGAGKSNKFSLGFDTPEIARKEGNTWEIDVPGLSNPDDYLSYNATLTVPKSFGRPSITKPLKEIVGQNSFTFSKRDIGRSGIYVLFGQAQYYKLNLKYHLSNQNLFKVKTEVALPPDTSYQDVRISKITPQPSDVYEDEDGNWLAVYTLNPNSKITINVDMIAKVYPESQKSEKTSLSYKNSDTYWQVGDPEIKKLGQDLKTPDKIYEYVVSKLSYNYGKVSSENVRLGAKNSLLKPAYAVCLEFTDLFVALARAAGIKTRAVEGYAYTENSKLRPVSLIKDVLHAWPEYYSETQKKWIMVDPTWGNTTAGMDYYNSFDYNHIAFVIKGKSSTYPVPAGGYKTDKESKDISVSFADPNEFYNQGRVELSEKFPDSSFSFFPLEGYAIIKNNSNHRYEPSVLTVKSTLFSGYRFYDVSAIPPHGEQKVLISFQKTKFLTNELHKVTIQFNGNSVQKQVRITMFPDFFWIILGGGILIGSTIIATFTVKTWRLYFQKR